MDQYNNRIVCPGRMAQVSNPKPYRSTSLIRNSQPHRISIGP